LIALDCEGDLSPRGQLALVQVGLSCAAPAGVMVLLFDVTVADAEVRGPMLALLHELLGSEGSRVVVHDGRGDTSAIRRLLDFEFTPVLDTQVAYAALERLRGGGDISRMALKNLLTTFSFPEITVKDSVKNAFLADRQYWFRRPLGTDALEYAALDVFDLSALATRIIEATRQFVTRLTQKYNRSSISCGPDLDYGGGSYGGYLRAASLPLRTPLRLTFSPQGVAQYRRHGESEPQADEAEAEVPLSHEQELERELEDARDILASLPEEVQLPTVACMRERCPQASLIEFVADHGRPPLARFNDNTEMKVSETPVDIQQYLTALAIAKGVSEPTIQATGLGLFDSDNRTGVSGSLHRISGIMSYDRTRYVGLTYRIGRYRVGIAELIRDVLVDMLPKSGSGEPRSLLIVGPPGRGKTVLLRDITRFVASELRKRTVVVDTSREIGGDEVVPHEAIGSARRMTVPHRDHQHRILLEALSNHTPEVCVCVCVRESESRLIGRVTDERNDTLGDCGR